MNTPAFRLTRPRKDAGPAVFSSPHSGDAYSDRFLRESQLDPLTLRSSEDAFVDDLFGAAPDMGAPLIAAVAPRAYVDLNRAETELDPAVVAVSARSGLNPRLAAGLGVIPRVVAEGRVIRAGRISRAEAEARIATYHRPYHETLRRLLSEARARHGYAVLYDCHSMPRDALRSHLASGGRRPDIVLGDRFGSACAPWVTEAARAAFMAEGFHVALNAPFAGGFITQCYGRPDKGFHALQIEIDRSLYMNERTIRRLRDFASVQARLSRVIAALAGAAPERLPYAAE
ncbi:MAG: N-formylglutamate amidohydrolase [Rubricella sp.]